jgi:hypothetical protein
VSVPSVEPEIPAEIPGQLTIEEATVTEGEQNSDPTSADSAGTSPESAPGPVAEGASSGNGGPPEPNPTDALGTSADVIDSPVPVEGHSQSADSVQDTPDEHRFRITHETSNPGAPSPHSVLVSAPMMIADAVAFLADLGEKFL